MKKNRVAKPLAAALQFMILVTAPGLTHTQTPAPQAQPSVLSRTQADLYADAFAGLTYTDGQKEAIGKIHHDIGARKTAVLKDDKLTKDQKDAMLTGFTRMEYALIYKELTPEQKKVVSTRMRTHRAADQAAPKTQAPAR